MAHPPLPIPAVQRVAQVYARLGELCRQGIGRVSSKRLGEDLGTRPHNIRKDLSLLGEGGGQAGSAYDVPHLRERIAERLGLGRPVRTCVVGLGRLGTALVDYPSLRDAGCNMIAGFDSNVNRVETVRLRIPAFPAYQMTEIIRRESIELGIIAVPADSAQETADRLVESGIKAILNFAPVVVRSRDGIVTRNIDMVNEYLVVSALLWLENNRQHT